jgi:hypothetical protein
MLLARLTTGCWLQAVCLDTGVAGAQVRAKERESQGATRENEISFGAPGVRRFRYDEPTPPHPPFFSCT